MAIGRYTFTPKILGRKILATSNISYKIYFACDSGLIPFTTMVIKEAQRLDHIAGKRYGSSSLWWVIAAASNIGWGLQVPAGTRILMPNSLEQISDIVE